MKRLHYRVRGCTPKRRGRHITFISVSVYRLIALSVASISRIFCTDVSVRHILTIEDCADQCLHRLRSVEGVVRVFQVQSHDHPIWVHFQREPHSPQQRLASISRSKPKLLRLQVRTKLVPGLLYQALFDHSAIQEAGVDWPCVWNLARLLRGLLNQGTQLSISEIMICPRWQLIFANRLPQTTERRNCSRELPSCGILLRVFVFRQAR